MKHIEVSRKISLEKAIDAEGLKRQLVENLEKSIEIETISDGTESFSAKGTTGSIASFIRHVRVDMESSIEVDEKAKTARIIISSYSRTARSLLIWYMVLFCLLLLIGLLPGSIETSEATSGAGDALVFIMLGIFIDYDINKKLAQPKEFLETALDTLETKFG